MPPREQFTIDVYAGSPSQHALQLANLLCPPLSPDLFATLFAIFSHTSLTISPLSQQHRPRARPSPLLPPGRRVHRPLLLLQGARHLGPRTPLHRPRSREPLARHLPRFRRGQDGQPELDALSAEPWVEGGPAEVESRQGAGRRRRYHWRIGGNWQGDGGDFVEEDGQDCRD